MDELLKEKETIIKGATKEKGIGNYLVICLIFFFRRLNVFLRGSIIRKSNKINYIEKSNLSYHKIFSPNLTLFSLHL